MKDADIAKWLSDVCVCRGKRRYKSTGGYKFAYAESEVACND